MNKPEYLGFFILDRSEIAIYKFFYDYIKEKQ